MATRKKKLRAKSTYQALHRHGTMSLNLLGQQRINLRKKRTLPLSWRCQSYIDGVLVDSSQLLRSVWHRIWGTFTKPKQKVKTVMDQFKFFIWWRRSKLGPGFMDYIRTWLVQSKEGHDASTGKFPSNY